MVRLWLDSMSSKVFCNRSDSVSGLFHFASLPVVILEELAECLEVSFF